MNLDFDEVNYSLNKANFDFIVDHLGISKVPTLDLGQCQLLNKLCCFRKLQHPNYSIAHAFFFF